jgi:hypothetical protein
LTVAGNIMAIQVGRLSLSRITYICDLQQASALVLPLGVIAEMTLGPVRILGLIARTRLGENETVKVGPMIRSKLAAPFDFLKEEFEWAWSNTEKGTALAKLARRHAESLFFAPPTVESFRKAVNPDAWPTAAEIVGEDLRRKRNAEFYLMLAELQGLPKVEPNREMSELAA